MFDSLRSLSDHQILVQTEKLTAQERKLTVSILLHLGEIERRKLHLKQGYGSMFEYCTARLKLSEPAALRRIRTARCLVRFPQLREPLETGDINLTTVSMVARYLNPGNVDAVIQKIAGKSKRDVERLVAEYEPRAVVPPDRVRTIVVPAAIPAVTRETTATKFTVAGDGKFSDTDEPSTPNAREQETVRAEAASRPVVATMERRALVQFSASEDVMHKLDHVRVLASHRVPGNASFEVLVHFLAEYFLEREDPKRRQERREKRATVQRTRSAAKNPRQIPVAIRDQVFVRDRQQCAYVSPGGKHCGSTHVLQIDHIRPVSRGGTSVAGNLRLLCAHHNRLEAARLMGEAGRPARRVP